MLGKLKYKFSLNKGNQAVYLFSTYLFVYAVIDSIVAFILPILTAEYIPSLFIVGLILASSSIWDSRGWRNELFTYNA